jgi:hypothetical protein
MSGCGTGMMTSDGVAMLREILALSRYFPSLSADSEEAGHLFRSEGGHLFRREAGRDSQTKPDKDSDRMSDAGAGPCGSLGDE